MVSTITIYYHTIEHTGQFQPQCAVAHVPVLVFVLVLALAYCLLAMAYCKQAGTVSTASLQAHKHASKAAS